MLSLELHGWSALWFDDGSPVRAASAIARSGCGWLIAQEDATHAAWQRAGAVTRLRLFPPVDGRDLFCEDDGTKRLKPDLEGACVIDDRLRWFQRGDRRRGVPDASVDVDLAALLAAVTGDRDPADVPVGDVRRYDLSPLQDRDAPADPVPLAITGAVALDNGAVLVAAAAEDTADPVADGPVSAAAFAVLKGQEPVAWALLPSDSSGTVPKVEGLAILATSSDAVELFAVVDADDPTLASPLLHLTVSGYA